MVDIWNTNHGALEEWRRQRKTRIFGEKSVILLPCAMQNSHRRAWEQTRPYVLTSRRLTVWAMPWHHIVTRDYIKVNESRNRPGVVHCVPAGLGSQISWHSARETCEVSLTHRPLYPQECSWYSLSLGAESTPGPWNGRKEICHWKIQLHHRESIPRPSD